MPYSFILNSANAQVRQVALVRDLVDDVTLVTPPEEGKHYFLSDERIKQRLSTEKRDGRTETHLAKMAAASVLDTLATNQAYVLKVGQTLGESRDGAAVAASIRAHAKSLRAEVAHEEALNIQSVAPERIISGSVSVEGFW